VEQRPETRWLAAPGKRFEKLRKAGKEKEEDAFKIKKQESERGEA